jgi:hypothetical protein
MYSEPLPLCVFAIVFIEFCRFPQPATAAAATAAAAAAAAVLLLSNSSY